MTRSFVVPILALVVLLSAGCSSGRNESEQSKNMSTRDINQVKDAHTDELMALKGVVGVYVGALDDGRPCIGVMVEKKTPELEKKIPRMIEGYPVKVDETGVVRPLK